MEKKIFKNLWNKKEILGIRWTDTCPHNLAVIGLTVPEKMYFTDRGRRATDGRTDTHLTTVLSAIQLHKSELKLKVLLGF